MFKGIIFVAAVLSAGVSQAADPITAFNCKTAGEFAGDPVVNFKFNVVNLRDESAQLDYSYIDKKAEEWGEVVRVTKPKVTAAKTLNDNYEIHREAKGIRLFGDGDGCQFVRVVLYKDSDFTRGYISLKDGGCGGDGDDYQKVVCKVRDL